MDIRVVSYTGEAGKWQFLVKDAFDDSDAIFKVRKYIVNPKWLEGAKFSVKRVNFTEDGVTALEGVNLHS